MSSFSTVQPANMMTDLLQYFDRPPPRRPRGQVLQELPLPPRHDGNYRPAAYPPMPYIEPALGICPSNSSHSLTWNHNGAPIRFEDTQLLLSALNRGLIPAEKLEPDQCQQLLAAQQHFSRHHNRHLDARPSPPLRPEQLRRPFFAPNHPYPPGQPSPMRPSPAMQAQFRPPPYPGLPSHRQMCIPPALHPHNLQLNHANHANHRAERRPSSPLVHPPLQLRPAYGPEKKSSYDAARTEARRVQWVEEMQRAKHAEHTKKQDDVSTLR